jgi:xanthine/CO dehydrogenase XdhC/CoxF family maturation factor
MAVRLLLDVEAVALDAAPSRLHRPIGDRSLGKLPATIAIGALADLLRLVAAAPGPAPE